MPAKKGFWTLTRTVRITYTQRDDYNSDEPLSLKKAKEAADAALDETNSDAEINGIVIDLVKGQNWEEDDYEEDED